MPDSQSTPPPRVTLRFVAAAAGVSLTTASFALNNSGSVSAACREKVRATAQRLGYQPDKRVSEIMRRVRHDRQATYRETIAILDMWPTRGGWHEPVANQRYRVGMMERAAALGYELQEHWLGEPGTNPRRTGAILHARGIRGVIIPPTISAMAGTILDWNEFAAVTIGPSVEVPIMRVCNHRFRTVRTAIDHLVALGYTRIGYMMAQHPLPLVEEFWCSGFITYQAKIPRKQQVPVLIHQPGDLAAIRKWHLRHQPDAVLLHDMDQVGAIRDAAKTNCAIAYLNWERGVKDLAGIDQRSEQMGASAIDALMGQLLRNEIGLPQEPTEIMVESVWRNGASAPRKQ